MWTCNKCHTENNVNANFCIECGTAKPKLPDNYCNNPNCEYYKVVLANPEQKHCKKCGQETIYWKKIEDLC